MQMNTTWLKIPVGYLEVWLRSWNMVYWQTTPALWSEQNLNPQSLVPLPLSYAVSSMCTASNNVLVSQLRDITFWSLAQLNGIFILTAQILACSLANFYHQ